MDGRQESPSVIGFHIGGRAPGRFDGRTTEQGVGAMRRAGLTA